MQSTMISYCYKAEHNRRKSSSCKEESKIQDNHNRYWWIESNSSKYRLAKLKFCYKTRKEMTGSNGVNFNLSYNKANKKWWISRTEWASFWIMSGICRSNWNRRENRMNNLLRKINIMPFGHKPHRDQIKSWKVNEANILSHLLDIWLVLSIILTRFGNKPNNMKM
jgi:hypothetical protein